MEALRKGMEDSAGEQIGGRVLGHVVRLTKSTDCLLWRHQRNNSQSSAGIGIFHSEQADVGGVLEGYSADQSNII